jgi:hypothetical protein
MSSYFATNRRPWPAKRDPLLLKRRSPQLNQHRTLTRPQDAFIKPAPSCPSPTICDSCARGNGISISICICISMSAPPYPRPTAGQGAHHGVLSALFAWTSNLHPTQPRDLAAPSALCASNPSLRGVRTTTTSAQLHPPPTTVPLAHIRRRGRR